jgi:hypothetical protein
MSDAVRAERERAWSEQLWVANRDDLAVACCCTEGTISDSIDRRRLHYCQLAALKCKVGDGRRNGIGDAFTCMRDSDEQRFNVGEYRWSTTSDVVR